MENKLEKVFGNNKNQTKEQTTFLKRVEEIKILKAELERLSVEIPKARTEFNLKTNSIQSSLTELFIKRIEILENALFNQKHSKKIKSGLTDIIVHECFEIMQHHPDDKRVHDIVTRVRNAQPPEEKAMEKELENLFEKLDTDPEETENVFGEDTGSKKFQKQQAKSKAKSEAQKRSMRDIYKDLIKLIHPDKELNETEKKAKEEMAKEINVAYQNNDLLKLLEFELQLMSASTERINELAKERLKMYNEILLKQKQELDIELYRLKNENSLIYHNMCTKIAKPDRFMKKVINELQEKKKKLDYQLILLDTEKSFLKHFVAEYMRHIEDDFL